MACRVSCTICGIPIVSEESWPKWMRQFRAVYTKDGRNEHWNSDVPARLSGVGQRGYYVDLAPVGHSGGSKRSRGAVKIDIELMVSHLLGPGLALPGLQPVARGYALHSSCWRILVMVSPGGRVDIQRLRDLLRSFPIHNNIMNFGHDYGGIAEYSELLDSGLVAAGEERLLKGVSYLKYPRCDPLDIPALRGFLKKWSSAYDGGGASAICPYNGPAKADVFSKVPEEILNFIFEHLPSPDVARLRQSSRICATTTLRDSFWRSRFQPGREFDYILGPDLHPMDVVGRWKPLYLFTRAVQDIPDVANRRRVWGLARSLQRLLATSSKTSLHGDEVASADWRHWITASRSLWGLEYSFDIGSRALRMRTVDVPDRARIFVSTVEVYGTCYVSGIRLECESVGGIESSRLGYFHSEILVSEDAMAISGFVLAHGERGIRGIAVLSATGVLSLWVGDHENIPKRRLVLGPVGSKEGIIRYLKGGFDALKLVSLSISNDDHQKDDGTPTPSLRDSVTWYPDTPDPHYSIIGIGLTGRDHNHPQSPVNDNHPQRPVTLAIFGGSNGDRLRKVRGVSGRFDSMGLILGLTVSYTDGSEKVRLEVDTGDSMKTRSTGLDDSASGSELSEQGTDWDEEADDEDGNGDDSEAEEDETDYDGDEEVEEDYYGDDQGFYEEDEDNVVFPEEELTFEINSQNAERIVGIDVLRETWNEYSPAVMKTIKIHTNKGREVEFPPRTVRSSRRGRSPSVEFLRSEKGVVIGFCSRVSSQRGLTDIGIVVRNNLR